MAKKKTRAPARSKPAQPASAFDLHDFLESAGMARKITKFPRSAVIFSQGDPADRRVLPPAGQRQALGAVAHRERGGGGDPGGR